jgi:hypothetical protein
VIEPAASHAIRRFKIGWKKKAAAFRVFDALPGGSGLYYLTQRYVTRTIPRDLAKHGGWQFEHARTFRRFYTGDLGRARLFEFGAGWDLHSNLVQWCYGLNDQVVVDISRLARLDLVNRVIAHLRENPPPECLRVPGELLVEPLEHTLLQHYGIRYLAPADARHTALESGSVDLICTTSVLEHIPASMLREIMQECRRIAGKRSVMSHVVDYTDHYAHSDSSISLYNFMRFSAREWERYNPAIHYQNRLRHFEYAKLFDEAGFVPLAENVIDPDASSDPLSGLPLSEPFCRMSPDELRPRTGHWVLALR